jgi:hypothetical protein
MTGWRRSSYCTAGDCLDVSGDAATGLVYLRRIIAGNIVWDSMVVERAEFTALAKGIKAGEFDDLIGDSHE